MRQASLPFDGSAESRRDAAEARGAGQRGDPVLVRHRAARRYVLRVRDDGSVRVTVPRWGSRRQAMAFLQAQRGWVDQQRARMAAERAQAVEGWSPEPDSVIRARARQELPVRLQELAAQFGLTVSRVSIRNQRRRWGSCSPAGHICLNWRLAGMPDHVRDYVLIHELMHLKRMDHSRAFWKLVAAACPGYQAARGWLRRFRRLS